MAGSFRRNPEFMQNLRAAVQGATIRAAEQGEKRARRLIEGSTQSPSAPGDPPSSVSGELLESIGSGGLPSTEPTRVMARFGSNALHSKFLELGTKHMEPRPFLRPALAEGKKEMLQEFGGII